MEAQPSPEPRAGVKVENGASDADIAPGFGPRRRAAWSVVAVALFVGQVAMGVRSRLDDDDRYGFAMFHEFTSLTLRYRWRLADGSTRPFTPDEHLRGRSNAVRGSGRRTEVFGAGTTRIQVTGFVKWLYKKKRPDDAVGVEVTYAWERNKDGVKHTELIAWPPDGGQP